MKTETQKRLDDLTPRKPEGVRGGAVRISRSRLQVRQSAPVKTYYKLDMTDVLISSYQV